MTVKTIDLLDPEWYATDPHDDYRWMRENEPVYRDDANGLWGISRHADVRDVELRSEVFVSGQGYRANYYPDERNMIAQDNPRHRQQRHLVAARFTPNGVRQLEADIRGLVIRLVEAVIDDGACDVVEAFAAQLPSRLTCRLLGFPEEDMWRTVKGWSERLMRTDMAFRSQEALLEFGGASMEIAAYVIGELIPAKRRSPDGGLVSLWANAVIDGEPLDDQSVMHETGLFIAGGAETTRTSIAHGLRAFCDAPDQWDAMAADPALVPDAVEEVLRWVTPLNNFFRTCVADTEVGGVRVCAGDKVVMLYPSANRDAAVFTDPYVFDIRRSPNPHIAFGFGTHFCVGNHLARLTLRVLFEELAARITALEPVAEPDVEPNIFARAVRSFPLRFSPRR